MTAIPMKYSIRDLFFVTLLAAILLGWWIDHRAAIGRETAWEKAFQEALEKLSFHVQKDAVTVESPIGPWTIHCTGGAMPDNER